MAYNKQEGYDQETTDQLVQHYHGILSLLGEDPESARGW